MSIQGGRYLEAEKQIGEIIVKEPSPEAYFMLGTVKSNLLLDSNRSYQEVQLCFNKCLEMSKDVSQSEKDIMVFCLNLHKQLSELENELIKQKNKQKWNVVAGLITTFAFSKIIDNSSGSFGVIGGLVGASYGVGLSLESLSNIGDFDEIRSFVIQLKNEMTSFLKVSIKNEVDLLRSEILSITEKGGSIIEIDTSLDSTELEKVLGINFVSPVKAVSLIEYGENIQSLGKLSAAEKSWRIKKLFKKPIKFSLSDGESVLFGLKSNKSPNLMEYLFTSKGIYYGLNPRLIPYQKASFKYSIVLRSTFLNLHYPWVSISHSFLGNGLFSTIDNQKNIISVLNSFCKSRVK